MSDNIDPPEYRPRNAGSFDQMNLIRNMARQDTWEMWWIVIFCGGAFGAMIGAIYMAL